MAGGWRGRRNPEFNGPGGKAGRREMLIQGRGSNVFVFAEPKCGIHYLWRVGRQTQRGSQGEKSIIPYKASRREGSGTVRGEGDCEAKELLMVSCFRQPNAAASRCSDSR